MVCVSILCVLGMLISMYAYHVETSIHSDPTFQALCDISESMSCTKVFSSKYGRGFGLIEPLLGKDSILNQPNSVFGVTFYVIQAILAFNTSGFSATVQLFNAILSCVGCAYLAYILVYILHDMCVVCVSTYVINGLILACSILKYRAVSSQVVTRESTRYTREPRYAKKQS